MKIAFMRFLLVCWVLVGLIIIAGVIGGLVNLSFEIIWVSIMFAMVISAIIMAASFTFMGIIDPRKLYRQIK